MWRQQCLNVIEHVGSWVKVSPEGSTPARSPTPTLNNVSHYTMCHRVIMHSSLRQIKCVD